MEIRRDAVQYSIYPYIPIHINKTRLESLKSYLKWKNLQEEIDKLGKDTEKLRSATLNIKDSKEQLVIFLNEEILFAQRDLTEEIKNWLSHFGGTEAIILDKLIRLKSLKDLNVNVDIEEKGLPSGISKAKRDKEITEMSEKIKSLKSKQEKLIPEEQKGKGEPFCDEKFMISNWEKLSPLFWDAIAPDGRFLNVDDEVDQGIEELYFQLGHDKIPKIPYYQPLTIGEETYEVPLSHGNPKWKSKEK